MENKPLLFIHTVQTKVSENVGQTKFDSRINQPITQDEVIEEEIQEVQEVKEIDELNISKKNNNIKEDVDLTLNEIEEDIEGENEEIKEMSSKLIHQINLLDKRAKQEHYVYIEVTSNNEMYKGYFKGLIDHKIILSEESEVIEFQISDISDLKILKV